MAESHFSTTTIDYLQRVNYVPPPLGEAPRFTGPAVDGMAAIRILRVGTLTKAHAASNAGGARVPTDALLIGLYTRRVPFAMVLDGSGSSHSLALGTWVPAGTLADADVLRQRDANLGVLKSVLSSVYALIDVEPFATERQMLLPAGGLVLGVPSVRNPDQFDQTLPIDRLVRAMTSSGFWRVVMVAQPLHESVTHTLRLELLNEMQRVSASTGGLGALAPSRTRAWPASGERCSADRRASPSRCASTTTDTRRTLPRLGCSPIQRPTIALPGPSGIASPIRRC
jgi:hypothetical protein